MLRIAVNTLINRPVQDVWDFFIELTNSPRWTRSGSGLRQRSEGPLGVGTRLSRWGELELGRAEGLLGPILTRVLRGGWGTEMSNLKRLIEARP